jgi:hypothetical protein
MRTFVFGAGASVHAGYPLASQLWRSLEDWARTTFAEDHDFRDAVETMNAEFDLSRSFELVLTELDQRVEPLVRERPTTQDGMREKIKFVNLRSRVTAMIPLYFNSLRSQPAKLYEIFCESLLVPGDAIITFNYDLALDRELRRSGKWSVRNGYGFPVNDSSFGDSPCKLFKLHGSTNWRGEVFEGSRGFRQVSLVNLSLGRRPVIDSSELEYLGYFTTTDPQCHNGPVRIESLIMPTANKRFFVEASFGREWENFWDSLWAQAGEALNTSGEVYVLGYSLPEYDTRTKELLRTRIDRDAVIRVCCHSDTAAVIESLKGESALRHVDVQPAPVCTFEGFLSATKR